MLLYKKLLLMTFSMTLVLEAWLVISYVPLLPNTAILIVDINISNSTCLFHFNEIKNIFFWPMEPSK
jgi:hypothetical protein